MENVERLIIKKLSMICKKLLKDRVLIEQEIVEEKTASGLIIAKKDPEMDDALVGRVVAAGTGVVVPGVGLVPVDVAVGDKVMFQFGRPVRFEGKVYLLVTEADVIMVI